jgi:hypothetical protein
VRRSVDRGDGDGPCRAAGVRSPRTTTADRHGASRARLPLRSLWRANPGGLSRGVAAPVQYGTRVCTFVLYLLHYQLLPEKRLAALMADLFGVHHVTATIARISQDCARHFQSFADAVRDRVAAAPIKHMDETGFRIGGKTQWLHIASTLLLTFYRVSPRRGSLLAHVTGIVVHDHWKPYYTLKAVLHALRNAHHLREPKALVEIEKEDWARKMQRLLRRACHATNLARERAAPMTPGLIALIERSYDTILTEGFEPALISAAAKAKRPAGRRDGLATTFCCVSALASPTYSASWPIRLFRSPTTWQNEMGE